MEAVLRSFMPEVIYEFRCLKCGMIIYDSIQHLHSHVCFDGSIGYLQEIGYHMKEDENEKKEN